MEQIATANEEAILAAHLHEPVADALRAGTFARLDPKHMRTVRNNGDEQASVLIVSAPRSSGYESMSWA